MMVAFMISMGLVGVQVWLFLLAQALVVIGDKMPDFTSSCKAIAGLIMLLAVLGTAFVFVQQCFAKVKEKQRAKTMRGDGTDSHSLSAADCGGTWQRRTSWYEGTYWLTSPAGSVRVVNESEEAITVKSYNQTDRLRLVAYKS